MKKIFVILLLIMCLMLTGCEKKYDTTDFLTKIQEESDITVANLAIVIKKNDGNGSVFTTNSSGIVIDKENNKYYAITTYYELAKVSENDQIFIVLGNESLWDPSSGVILEEFYNRIANIEKIDEENNIALLSFESEIEIPVVKIANHKLKRTEKVASISNTTDKYRGFISFGIIESKISFNFEAEDGKIYDCIKHSCYIYKGSSGSMLINENLELVGMNIGYTKDLFGKVDYGIAIYCDKINDFLN